MTPLTDLSLATLRVPLADAEVVTGGVSSDPVKLNLTSFAIADSAPSANAIVARSAARERAKSVLIVFVSRCYRSVQWFVIQVTATAAPGNADSGLRSSREVVGGHGPDHGGGQFPALLGELHSVVGIASAREVSLHRSIQLADFPGVRTRGIGLPGCKVALYALAPPIDFLHPLIEIQHALPEGHLPRREYGKRRESNHGA